MARPAKSTTDQFGKIGIGLHWISALLIIVLLGSGFRAGFATDTGVKTAALQVHLPVAILVLVPTVFRLIWWWRFDKKPGPVWAFRLGRTALPDGPIVASTPS